MKWVPPKVKLLSSRMQDATVGDVDGLEIDGEALAEILAKRKVERRVPWQMVAGILG